MCRYFDVDINTNCVCAHQILKAILRNLETKKLRKLSHNPENKREEEEIENRIFCGNE